MSFNNYKEFKETVSVWLNRKDSVTVNNIPTFINFAEKQFTRLIKLPYYEARSSFVINERFNFVVIPQDLLSVKHLTVNGRPYNRVDNETFMRLKSSSVDTDYQGSGVNSVPVTMSDRAGSTTERGRMFTRIGEQIHFLPEPTIGDLVELIYHQDIPEMRYDADQPYSILIAPDVMLYLALRHAAIFLRDNEQEQYWMMKAQEAADSMNKQLEEAEWSGSSLVVPFFNN